MPALAVALRLEQAGACSSSTAARWVALSALLALLALVEAADSPVPAPPRLMTAPTTWTSAGRGLERAVGEASLLCSAV